MYESEYSDYYNEWVELYNNNSYDINLSGWKFCDNELLPGFINHSDSNLYLNTSFIVPADAYAVITDGGSGTDAYDNYNISGLAFHVDASTICNGLSNSGDLISLYNQITLIDFVNYDTSLGADHGKSLQLINETWYASFPTPGYENFLNITEEEPEQDLTFTISINKEQFDIGDELIINGNFTNTYNFSIDGNLIIKIGKEKIEGGFEYPEDYILINENITLPTGITEVEELTWIVPDNTFSGEYKVYAPFKSEIQNRQPSKIFSIHGLGNIFIDSWDIDNYNLDLENNTLTASINLTNNETSPFLINLSIMAEDLKTVSAGKNDFEYFCNIFSISNSTTENCNFILPNDVITNGTLEFDIYSKIAFLYDNTTIVKKSQEKKINITGLEDLGDPTLEILSDNLTAKFGDFTSVFVRYNTNNYNFPLRFIAYAYTPKRISMDLNTDTIYKKFCEVNTAVELQNLERGKTIYLSLPLFIKKNCDNDYQDEIYESFVRTCEFKSEWDYTDMKEKFDLIISGNNNANCPITKYISGGGGGSSEKTITSKPLYEIISIPSAINLNQEFISKIRLNNNDKTDNKYSVWSYVYSGNKCYSGEREQNIQELSISADSSGLIELKNTALEEGDFKFKIKIRKNDQKTTKDITQEIKVLSLKEITETELKEEKEPEKDILKKKKTEPETVYLSSSAKARKLAPSFILSLLTFLSISIIWKKTI